MHGWGGEWEGRWGGGGGGGGGEEEEEVEEAENEERGEEEEEEKVQEEEEAVLQLKMHRELGRSLKEQMMKEKQNGDRKQKLRAAYDHKVKKAIKKIKIKLKRLQS